MARSARSWGTKMREEENDLSHSQKKLHCGLGRSAAKSDREITTGYYDEGEGRKELCMYWGRRSGRSGATAQKCKSARVQECKSTRVQECKSARVPKYKSAKVQECKSTRLLSGVGSGERSNLKKKDTANNKPWKAGSGSVEERARGITERSRPRKWISLVRDQLLDFAG
ncbi:hypothetical protein ACO22_02835 [Paracoccidioides brasiliensis]|uniref:Uncharacterized protein n=1 Tax=Paracoccidioides brasiliensis TaxID=121759 RepID=A0A1D2JHM6_PARBR|nr:hypothetical protein ACO22_02835 [Paracoccidioides brasiliensis]